ncbi:MAG: D12 class N6 adenine-specific DNA methyltransferase [Candidatus Moranbacteria bacterium GW2011_GWF2_36_839]|nr:MAG: D12 class N6 adenine-specific DNA methyltransferase [Candidatus Moranbacteria bacterium GW2011_GWF1_36_78]KKQ16487.1 MAG: D12 class N6 adenine-specific DNA methyltransferase [Candidatus Moranbacteria bacterium GW2011_GWF2_36_839]HAT74083.1 DNA methyltransferase [Candidatus Moranbacteria bacterium]HBY10708.1 DNA methyltransferase [Candidatus Moranbacteria bacterium]
MSFFSPLRYPGGKTRLYYFLEKAIVKNFSENEKIVLVEPYAGGAGASLKLLFSGKVDKIIINDLDRAIFSFWRIAVSDTDFLINKIKKVNIDIAEWRKQKEIYTNPTSTTRELAFATLFLNRTNRSGIIEGGPIGGMNQMGLWDIKARFTKNTIIKRLEKIKEFKDTIKVRNIDGITLLKQLGRNKKKSNYFIFLDPPYYQKGKSLYLNHYIDKDHKKLLKLLEKSSLKWVMTYDDVSYIQNLYDKFRKSSFVINHSAFKARQGKEVLIFSDNVVKVAMN